jgi:hypothetical protein
MGWSAADVSDRIAAEKDLSRGDPFSRAPEVRGLSVPVSESVTHFTTSLLPV